ncbi:PPOX class F420-dependent oxidoreductase [Mycobacterium sp. DL440]|uniref:PPOX class F420-dependent oxidoreductase n=1 Tax=Mycobacterium sp. DL440 TaxID=2675523 RepID=UPI001FB89492|nr:PPOX class F420-dependent oxidoreductase [Mycobacterium sp. DL440]
MPYRCTPIQCASCSSTTSGQTRFTASNGYSPDDTTIDIVGHALASTQKWRNVLGNPQVAFIVDTVLSVRPPEARGIEIRGTAMALPGVGTTDGGLSGDIIRIVPRRIISWGLDGAGTTARDPAEPPHTAD